MEGRRGRPRSPGELRHRIETLDRYAALGEPSTVEEEAFARELGIGVDRMRRLARMRRLGATDPAETQAASEDPDRRSAALRASIDADLARVSPSRRPLIAERLEVIRDHLSLERPTPGNVAASAAALGIGVPAFRRLVRCWISTLEPSALPGGSVMIRNARRTRPEVSSVVEAHMSRAVGELGLDVGSLALHRAVTASCTRDGLDPPSKSTTYARLMRARAEAKSDPSAQGFAVDHSAVALASRAEGRVGLPVLSIVFERSSGWVVAHSVCFDPPDPGRTAKLVLRATTLLPGGNEPLLIGVADRPAWRRLLASLHGAGVAASPLSFGGLSAGSAVGRTFGDVLGNMRLRPRRTASPHGGSMSRIMGRSSPLTPEQTRAAIADAVRLHNSSREPPLRGFAPAATVAVLERDLGRIAQGISPDGGRPPRRAGS